MREYNIVLYLTGSEDYLEYDVLYSGTKDQVMGRIRNDESLLIKEGGFVYPKYSSISAVEIREVPTDE